MRELIPLAAIARIAVASDDSSLIPWTSLVITSRTFSSTTCITQSWMQAPRKALQTLQYGMYIPRHNRNPASPSCRDVRCREATHGGLRVAGGVVLQNFHRRGRGPTHPERGPCVRRERRRDPPTPRQCDVLPHARRLRRRGHVDPDPGSRALLRSS